MQASKYMVYAIFAYLVIGILFLTTNYHWGYDEFGAVVSHLELDDESFLAVYKDFLYSKGLDDGYLLDFLIEVFLPVFIVPLRWTYAIGISPLLGISRIIEVDWTQLRIILFTPFAILASVGLYLIHKSLLKLQLDKNILLLFLLFLLSSPSFVHWSFTLSSYSYHIFCFGLIFYIEAHKDELPIVVFGKLSILRSLPILFNYQYIPIVAIFGVFDVFTKRPILNKKILAWIMPGAIALFSIVFLYMRSILIGKHDNPAISTMDSGEVIRYSFLENISSFSEVLSFLFSRIYDIFEYFYSMNQSLFFSSSYSNHHYLFGLFGLVSAFLIFLYIKKINSKLYSFLAVYIFAHMLMYLSGVIPMTPSRHSLILLPPFALVFAIVVNEALFKKAFDNKFYFSIVLIWFATIFGNYMLSNNVKQMSMEKVDTIRTTYEVNDLIMSPCDIEPVLHLEIRKKYNTLYKCGSRVIRRLSDSVNQIGFYSHNGVTLTDARNLIKDYSTGKWILLKSFDSKGIHKDNKDDSKYRLFIFKKRI